MELPDSEIYEQELEYMPYKDSLNKVISYISENAPQNGSLIDLMCGPGYLLGKIALARRDLKLEGSDIDERYISFATQKYPHLKFKLEDVLSLNPEKQYDIVMCTGALHHVPYDKQEEAVRKMTSLVKPNGFLLISDCYIDDYANETQRRIAAVKLGHEYLKETIQNGAPEEVIIPTIEILANDVLMKEFKTSLKKRTEIFKRLFSNVRTFKTWPNFESEYGDYISICESKFNFKVDLNYFQ
ncbi:MAG: class I SAM-dependent methyltransferase [Nanoarchaeota archaeon]